MTLALQEGERVTEEPSRRTPSLIEKTAPFKLGVALEAVNGIPGKYRYLSPETGETLALSLAEGTSKPPTVHWGENPLTGESGFFMQIAPGQEIDSVGAASRVVVELPLDITHADLPSNRPLVSVENGAFKVRQTKHGVTYVEIDGKTDAVHMQGVGIGREAHLLLDANIKPPQEPPFINKLHLHGHTYMQTHEFMANPHFFPAQDVFGTVVIRNNKGLELDNDRFNGYEVGMRREAGKLIPGNYSLADLRNMERSGLDRERSGHGVSLRPGRKRQEAKVEPETIRIRVNGHEALSDLPPALVMPRPAGPRGADAEYIQGPADQPSRSVKDIVRSFFHTDRPQQSTAQEATEAETAAENPHVDVLMPVKRHPSDVWSGVLRDFDKAGVVRVSPDVVKAAMAILLSASRNGTDYTFTPQALQLLAQQDLPYPIKGTLLNLQSVLRTESVEAVARDRGYGHRVIRVIDRALNPSEVQPEVDAKEAARIARAHDRHAAEQAADMAARKLVEEAKARRSKPKTVFQRN